MSKQFIMDNYDYNKLLFNSYNVLNEINVPSKIIKFPYNILKINAYHTYKEISINYIKDRHFYNNKNMSNKNNYSKNNYSKNKHSTKRGSYEPTDRTIVFLY